VEHRSSSEELLERALRELAREVYELKRKREQQSDERTETVTVELPEPLEDLPAVRRPEDPLAISRPFAAGGTSNPRERPSRRFNSRRLEANGRTWSSAPSPLPD